MPSPTPAPSPAPSDAPTFGPDQDVTRPPTPPAALDGPATENNAVLVGKYFMSLFPYMVATGDTMRWDALSGKNCNYCKNARRIATDIRDAGNHGAGGAFDIGFGSVAVDDDGSFLVGVQYVENPSQTLGPEGELVEDFPDTYKMQATLRLRWTNGTWQVAGANARQSGEVCSPHQTSVRAGCG